MSSSSSIREKPSHMEPPPTKEDTPPTDAHLEQNFYDVDTKDLPGLHTFPGWIKWIAAGTCFTSGVLSSYSFKMMNKQDVARCGDGSSPDCSVVAFNGPFLQTFLMFFGETVCLGLWHMDRIINEKKNKVPWSEFTLDYKSFNKKKGHWWGWSIPSALDTLATILANSAMTVTYASTVQMLRNFLVVICALLQLMLIRRALRLHEWVGVITITGAMVLTAVPAILMPEGGEDDDPVQTVLAIVFAIVGTSLHGLQIMFEEWLFTKWAYSPVKAVGVEGVTGMVYLLILFPICQVTGLEDVKAAWYQWAHSWEILVITFFYLIACILFNGAGLATTKLGGGLLRSVMFALRGPAVWILDLIVGWIAYDHYNLAAIFVFLGGFAIHARMWPAEKFPRWHAFFSIPWHWCCTKPELDEDYVPVEESPITAQVNV
eukprot:Protomagalhaensia_sp_Gyna_25__992@NODE_1480_length_1799_cov_3222_803409_g408_i1_p1_GENE_NODE_1480_length_1799_cov_3222_803409_g408_i1NODE_1480_length_1799_cov_3222_803409_g408_i1_p1_ORF_typecomplete_len431_score70_37SLC35F/PF06027_12/4_1e02SLC35F/PF06027_12/2_4e24CRTlike/PF08627_10/9_3e23Nuc_sug_transp/PF04142_15/1_4e03Nuc_sug_transp/PF04142_15/3_7e21Nuc_sug_transp/PF04142_15/1_9e02UAA/PF08449_11/4_2e11TPT/PF03151_16/1_5e09EamA/PF00892_20/8_4e02EamA/PF00892_20/2e06EamA/PF00892_20/3_9e03PUNUT/PF1